jgi:hypothetical protein
MWLVPDVCTSNVLTVPSFCLPAGVLTFWLSRGRGTLGVGATLGSTLYALLSTGEPHLHHMPPSCWCTLLTFDCTQHTQQHST